MDAEVWLTDTMSMQNLVDMPALSMDRLTILPGAVRTPVVHHECDELLYLLEGELEVFVNQRRWTVRAGDAVSIPRGTVHGSVNTSGAPVIMLAANSPAFRPGMEVEVSGPIPERSEP